ncbi:MAG: NADH-quinone oxidoreductase subunit C [Candidatus Kapabacteria bacterium]|nr:NADH-quinone oxidoreductase subunit C [Candidatus Kapabacteria bacterium]
MLVQEIYDNLKEKFPEAVLEFIGTATGDPSTVVDAGQIYNICKYLRDQDGLEFDYLALLSGMDYKDKFGTVYHLYSLKYKHRFVIKTYLPKEDPSLPSVERIWKTANWHEREAYDMFGIKFENHPNMIRILCPYDWEGYPLRKDYVGQETYHGVRIPV